MIIGSSSGWLMLAGMMARPAATSLRTNSGVMKGGDFGAEIFAIGAAVLGAFGHGFAADVFAVGDVGHLGGDDAGAGVLELGEAVL